MTDCNVLLGKLRPELFPAVFGPGADQPLDADVVRSKFEALATEVKAATGRATTPEALAEGFIAIAVQAMGQAIKTISIQRGHDVTRHVLNCFGGAGGQHACLVADALGMTTVLLHPFAGVLSAYGMGLADVRAIRQETVGALLTPERDAELAGRVEALGFAAEAGLAGQGSSGDVVSRLARAEVKYAGTDTPLTVPFGSAVEMQAAFQDQHRRRFGFVAERNLIVETLQVEAVSAPSAGSEAPVATMVEEGAVEPLRSLPSGWPGRCGRRRFIGARSWRRASPWTGRRSFWRTRGRRWSSRAGAPVSMRAPI
nr:hydantoinase/oxoprolinase family protein [Brevundimonas goettingensis]